MPTSLVSIHSFTPVYMGEPRSWHVGVLWRSASDLGKRILEGVHEHEPSLQVGANVPYTITDEGDYTIPVHGDERGIPAVLIEIRNDLLADDSGVKQWTSTLSRVIKSAIRVALEQPSSL